MISNHIKLCYLFCIHGNILMQSRKSQTLNCNTVTISNVRGHSEHLPFELHHCLMFLLWNACLILLCPHPEPLPLLLLEALHPAHSLKASESKDSLFLIRILSQIFVWVRNSFMFRPRKKMLSFLELKMKENGTNILKSCL